jgi:hypothetical protein
MRSLFSTGGFRNSLLNSKGLSAPLFEESPLPDNTPRWLHPQIYPNPTSNELTIDVACDSRWIGKTFTIYDINGRILRQVTLSSSIQVIDVSHLTPGIYFLAARKEDGSYIKQKFIKI